MTSRYDRAVLASSTMLTLTIRGPAAVDRIDPWSVRHKRDAAPGTDGALPRYGGKHGVRMTSDGIGVAGKRVLVVEDELMIRMLLEGMLTDLGYSVAAEAGAIDEAMSLAKQAEFDIALLDVNLNGHPITPVVEILIQRGLPFVFASGYGKQGVPEAYRTSPTLQKPFQAEALAQAIAAAMPKAAG
jgi:CheY-like chemotaxis protein